MEALNVRLLVAILLGAITTFALFWVMQALIGAEGELKEGGGRLSVDYVRLKRDNTPQLKKREPPKREKPKQQPPPPEMDMAKAMNPGAAVGAIVPVLDTGATLAKATSLGAGGADRDAHRVGKRAQNSDAPRQFHARIVQAVILNAEGLGRLAFFQLRRVVALEPHVVHREPPAALLQLALRADQRLHHPEQGEGGDRTQKNRDEEADVECFHGCRVPPSAP